MTLALTQSPAYPVPNRDIKVTFTATSPANYVRIFLADAPPDTKLKAALDSTEATQILSHEGPTSEPWIFTAERGGKYLFTAQEYQRGNAGHGGGYSGDPDGYPSETKVGVETSVEITVGQKLSMRIGTARDNASLELWVWGSTIRETSVSTHGESTPRITSLSTNNARTAAYDANVVSALAALRNVTATTALGDLKALANSMRLVLSVHFSTASGVHAAADTVNPINAGKWAAPDSPTGLAKVLVEYAKRFRLHVDTDADDPSSGGAGAGPGTGDWHDIGAGVVVDTENGLIVAAPSDIASSVVFLADLYRAYEAHRVDTDYHGSADTFSVMPALPPLLEVPRHFLTALAAIAPTAAPTDNPGITPLVHGAGMKEE
jgi:hypothetical protein